MNCLILPGLGICARAALVDPPTLSSLDPTLHLDVVRIDSRPEDRLVHPLCHARDSLVSSVNAYQILGSQGGWYHNAISVPQDSIYNIEVRTEPVVLPQRLVQLQPRIFFFCDLKPHTKFQKPTKTTSGRKVCEL